MDYKGLGQMKTREGEITLLYFLDQHPFLSGSYMNVSFNSVFFFQVRVYCIFQCI